MARELNIGTCEFAQRQRIFVAPDPAPVFPAMERELVRRPVVADLSVLPPHPVDGASVEVSAEPLPGQLL